MHREYLRFLRSWRGRGNLLCITFCVSGGIDVCAASGAGEVGTVGHQWSEGGKREEEAIRRKNKLLPFSPSQFFYYSFFYQIYGFT